MKNSKTFLICSLLTVAALFSTSGQATSYTPLPETIDDYMKTSDIIVVGRIGKVQKVHTFYGYQESAAELERLDSGTPLALGYPMVDYEIVIDEVVKADERFLSGPVTPVVLRVLQGHSPREAELAHRENQGEFMLFLRRNPDNETYGIYSFAHKVKLDSGKPMYSFEGKEWPILLEASSPEELLDAVRSAAVPY